MATAAAVQMPTAPVTAEAVEAVTTTSKSFEQLEVTKECAKGEEGVEVVLGERGPDQVVVDNGPTRPTPDQNVFRGAHPPRSSSSRGTAAYPHGPPPPPYSVHGSGSFGYGRPADHRPPRPYAVPAYNPSGSFEEGASYPHNSRTTPSHYSPHVQYPNSGARYAGEDINVISPHHKSSDPKYRSSGGRGTRPSGQHYYQYPPTSPVSRAGPTASPPRLKNFAARRTVDGPYSKAQRSSDAHPEDGTWNPFPAPSRTASGDRPQPPLVAESSFESDHFSNSHYSAQQKQQQQQQQHPSHPPTPGSGAPHHDPAQQFYGPGTSWGSFESAAPHRYDDQYSRHHPPHRTPSHHYPESPYSPYSTTSHSHHSSPGYHSHHSHYSPGAAGGYYAPDQYSSYHGYGAPQSYEEDHERGMLKDYHPDRDGEVMSAGMDGKKLGKVHSSNKTATGIVLPAAAHEIDFEVADPPAEPVFPPSAEPLVESLADVNGYDVLCGRGGGTNSQVGNKRFRQLVQDFQPTYLLARRKEKPLLARTIVLIIRKRGGRFLRKDEESGMLYDVGDIKAEAKTSQALREGLDVRATKSATTGKKKKKKGAAASKAKEEEEPESPEAAKSEEKAESESPEGSPERPIDAEVKSAPSPVKKDAPGSPPSLPKLADEEVKPGMVHPHSPEAMQFRKRRKMRSLACGADKFFPDFCPPRADLGRGASPTEGTDDILDDDGNTIPHSPMRRSSSIDEEDVEGSKEATPGCTAAVFEVVAGAVTGGFCFGPTTNEA